MVRYNVVSMSGGKDSTPVALLAMELEPPESNRYVFADTGNEHQAVYDYVFDYLPNKLGIQIDSLKRDFTDWWWHRRAYIAEKWPEKLSRGDRGHWKWLGIKRDKPQKPPAPPADIYANAEIPGWRWVLGTRPMSDAEIGVILDRVLPVFDRGPTGNPYLDLCMIKGRFPSRKAQFCTQFLKTEPLTEYAMALLDAEPGNGVWSWQGIRAQEGGNRKWAKDFEEVGGGLFINRPILRWKAEDCFEAMRHYGVEPNPLYRMGMNRVGCMPCINASKDEILELSKRFPEHIDRIEEWEAMVGLASKRGGSSFFPAPEDGRADIMGRNIREVVQWSRTTRGGRQVSLFADEETSGCSSSYGLCEAAA